MVVGVGVVVFVGVGVLVVWEATLGVGVWVRVGVGVFFVFALGGIGIVSAGCAAEGWLGAVCRSLGLPIEPSPLWLRVGET